MGISTRSVGPGSEGPNIVRMYADEVGQQPRLDRSSVSDTIRTILEGGGAEQDEAKSRLFHAHLWLAIQIAVKYSARYNIPMADLIQEGNMGLMAAIDNLDYRRGAAFSTYARSVIERTMIRLVRAKTREDAMTTNLDQPVGIDGEDTLELADVTADTNTRTAENAMITRELLLELNSSMDVLSRQQESVVRLYGLAEMPSDEVAAMLGITRNQVRRTFRTAVDKLRGIMKPSEA
ncbi:sigma-70 family RNA polymerase sigma factor [Candidatus Peregrinibacteria bacterium]|jgi:RNA polymerase sigma factor (sigma-70 family)|nr:sigma-70 family RNA polymerase sigma factor [Candidatus Peregrinibacteria bacterium]